MRCRRSVAAASAAFVLAGLTTAVVASGTASAAVPAPVATTVLGGGAGDGGPATQAQVNATTVAVDDEGDTWFYDRLVGAVRRVDHATGTITTAFANPATPPRRRWSSRPRCPR